MIGVPINDDDEGSITNTRLIRTAKSVIVFVGVSLVIIYSVDTTSWSDYGFYEWSSCAHEGDTDVLQGYFFYVQNYSVSFNPLLIFSEKLTTKLKWG